MGFFHKRLLLDGTHYHDFKTIFGRHHQFILVQSGTGEAYQEATTL
jgi:hypothetical protein